MATIAPSANMVALVQTAGALPFFFLSLIAGAFADTHDRRLVMLASIWLMFIASGVLAALALLGAVTPQVLFDRLRDGCVRTGMASGYCRSGAP